MFLQDLFSKEELELLLERKERYPILKHRNLIIIILLIYQGLTNGELAGLALEDVELEKGLVHIRASRRINGRSLKLESSQIFWLMQYLQHDRPQLQQKGRKETERLILSKLGKEENGEGIGYLLECKRHLFPGRKLNAKTVRQSVIANLLKSGMDLRKVQVFAGHKYPSTTEQYREDQTEELKNQVLKYHPLG